MLMFTNNFALQVMWCCQVIINEAYWTKDCFNMIVSEQVINLFNSVRCTVLQRSKLLNIMCVYMMCVAACVRECMFSYAPVCVCECVSVSMSHIVLNFAMQM